MGSKYFSDEIGVFAPSIGGEQLRALTSATLHIGMRKVDLHALDRAYSIAFPQATPINVNKKCRGKRRDSRFKHLKPEHPPVLSRSEWGRGATEGICQHRDAAPNSTDDARGHRTDGHTSCGAIAE